MATAVDAELARLEHARAKNPRILRRDAMAKVSPYVAGTQVLRTLGAGTYGRVVLARDPRGDGPQRSVEIALKVPRSGGTTRKQILWEAACLREVAHAHIIKLLEARASTPGGEECHSDLPTLVFPPADVDLATFLDRRPRGVLPIALARKMMGQLAVALAHVHSHGIVHRDVKPGNCLIFLAAEIHGEFLGPSLVLADFGMARRVSGDPRWCLDGQQVEPMTANVCTSWYRPPELWAATMDDHDVDQHFEETTPYGCSLDVWSFGAVVYEALSGETLARRAGTGAAMMQAVAAVIGECPTQGAGALQSRWGQHWKSSAAAKKFAPSRPLPESGGEWNLVRRCLRWDPSARVTMASAKQCAWFAERVATPDAAPTSQPGMCADASTLSTARADAPTHSAERRVHAWLQPDLSPPATTPKSSKTRCSCKGHCRMFKHRSEGKCDCTELVVGTSYCTTCKCIVAECGRPRHKSDFCFHHRNVVDKAPLRVQLAVAAVPVASLLIPCDIIDFLSTSDLLQDDLAMLILTAAIKEPLPVRALVEAWKQLPAQYSGSDLRSAILRGLAAADGAPHGAQLAQLHRKGVARFFGLITTASNLGVIGRAPLKPATKAAGAAQQSYRLGTSLHQYEVLDPSACKCDKFLEAARAEKYCLATPSDAGASKPCSLDVMVDYEARRLREVLQRIGAKSGALPFSVQDCGGYCIDYLTRKLMAARVVWQNWHECDWSLVSKASLQSMSADAKENLQKIPDTWRAAEISCFFNGRADWGLFASVFPCLWGEVAEKLSTKEDRAQAFALIKSKDFLRVVQSFRETEGIAPHPAVAYEIAIAQVKNKSKRAMVAPRASTSRKKRKGSAGVAK